VLWYWRWCLTSYHSLRRARFLGLLPRGFSLLWEVIDVSYNPGLAGIVPIQYSRSRFLQVLNVMGTNLTGVDTLTGAPLPEWLHFSNEMVPCPTGEPYSCPRIKVGSSSLHSSRYCIHILARGCTGLCAHTYTLTRTDGRHPSCSHSPLFMYLSTDTVAH
jgi:hypothetical protein